MKSSLFKYQLGLAGIGIFSLVIIIIVLVQAGATKADAVTDKAAQTIASKLNNYTLDRSTIPASLSEIGAKDVPDTISYQKVSDSSYKFCVTYKSTSSGFDATSAVTDLEAKAITGGASSDYTTPADTSYLIVSSTHHKGQNCQTIKPYSYDSSLYDGSSLSSSDSSSSPLDVYGGIQDKAKDTERNVDLKSLQGQLEAYYAENGYYPTLANLDDLSWVSTNLKGMDKEALRDPSGSTYTIADSASNGVYGYYVTDNNYDSCDNVKTDCTKYDLEANLSDGSPLDLYSLN